MAAAEVRWPLIIGGATLLGVVLWGLTVRGTPSEEEQPSGAPGGPPVRGVPGPPPRYLDDPWTLETGSTYRMRVEGGAGGVTISAQGLQSTRSLTDSQLVGILQDLGFDVVTVYDAGDPLPANWPAATTEGETSATRYVEATFTGPTGSPMRPPEIYLAWQAP